ncbi:hypothetical protein Aph02nite_20930 [Actinoplanes philippinensis]|uniref:Uncharacterized protein n=1 Tax=Actinoplanes philippinensis TaxID=35752 RepID=A0A1I2BW43_9ACTN|nr:hypothetical protein [Actinoplanes philippinensis]GIE76143.1 hypothetical protein Aph02nite_20930 [Actinoplanes philippinensis]SFE60212.1 hypothetical protein SAMN05421541_102558 [Actinoplanes philippinensis]
MGAFDDISRASEDLIFAALDYAVENAGISPGGFTPFVFSDGAAGRGLTRYVSGDGSNLQECQDAARAALQTVDAGVTCVALAWDGYYTHQGERSEAVFVEGYELGQEHGLLLAQRYTRDGGAVRPVGNPALIGRPTPLVHQGTGRHTPEA